MEAILPRKLAVSGEGNPVSSAFGNKIRASDITMVLSIRAHAGNPWILERIKLMGEYYSPCPPILVVDFGSEPQYAASIAELCANRGYTLVAVPDFDVFSLSKARNIAFENSDTQFVFFCDPDFFGERDLFKRLADTAMALDMRNVVDIILNPPAYHIGKFDTDTFENLESQEERSLYLRSLGWKANYTSFDKHEGTFVAPYSNVFLINRHMFSLVGGYDSNFRGHGSEDFEFLLRLAIHTMHLPLPSAPDRDLFSPTSDNFFRERPYEGFRRLFELMSQPTETLGLKVFHLWHERQRDSEWYKNNDWRRNRFQDAVSLYLDKPHELLAVDHLTRRKKVYCLCKNKDTWGYFLPLRLADFELIPIFSDDPKTIRSVTEGIVSGDVDAIAIFNPYMKSHSAFSGIVVVARELGREVIILERGALPSSIYYNDDVCYNSPLFEQSAFDAEVFTKDELEGAKKYIASLRNGDDTLESMDLYEVTDAKYLALRHTTKNVCFIPLQLEDDMAVTMFLQGEQTYSGFLQSLPELIDNNPDVIFVVKPHPLSKGEALRPRPNLIVADRMDNVHCLIDIADVVICYNSGVGLLSLIHHTPTITLGNAFYNYRDAGYRATSAQEGLASFKFGSVPSPSSDLVIRIVAWFIYRKYSFFCATDQIKEFKERKSHGYKDIAVTHFRWKSVSVSLERLMQKAEFSWTSYAAARIAPAGSARVDPPKPNQIDWKKLEAWGKKDFHLSHFGKSSDLFLRAYKANPSKPNLLRYAAESLLRAGRRSEAIARQEEYCRIVPTNYRAKLRLKVMKHPLLAAVLGRNEMEVPK